MQKNFTLSVLNIIQPLNMILNILLKVLVIK